MKDYKFDFNANGKNYSLVFNLNVMQAIQEEYGTIQAWGALTDRNSVDEIDAKALIFGLKEMLNEAIDITNETREPSAKEPFLNSKQVGRIITQIGLKESAEQLNQLIIESTKSEEKNA